MKFDSIINFLVVLILVAVTLYTLYTVYGQLTQHDVVTVVVLDKEIVSSTTTVNHKSHTNLYYLIRTNDETFQTTFDLYHNIIVGKKHTFYVAGFYGSRLIQKVLE